MQLTGCANIGLGCIGLQSASFWVWDKSQLLCLTLYDPLELETDISPDPSHHLLRIQPSTPAVLCSDPALHERWCSVPIPGHPGWIYMSL